MNASRGVWLVRAAFALVATSLGIWVGIEVAAGSARDLVHPEPSDWRVSVVAVLLTAVAASALLGYIGVRGQMREFSLLAWLGPSLIVAGAGVGLGWIALTAPMFIIRDASAAVSVGDEQYAGGEFGGVCVSLPGRNEIWHLYADGSQTRIVVLRSGTAMQAKPVIGAGEVLNVRVRTQYLIGFFQGGENPPILRQASIAAVDPGGWAGVATLDDGDLHWECTEPRTIHAPRSVMAP